MATPSRRIITFELPQEDFDALQHNADAFDVASRHQRARDIVSEYLASGQVAGSNEGVERLDAEVAFLQELIRRTTYVLLVNVGGVASDDANRWIRRHMARPTAE